MLLDDSFASNRFLSGKRSAFGQTYLCAILLGFSDTLADTTMEVSDFFLGLLKGGFDLLLCMSHHEIVYELDVVFEEVINCGVSGLDAYAQHIITR